MSSVQPGLHRRVLEKISNLAKILEEYSNKNPYAKNFVEKITELYKRVEKYREPLIPSRNYIEIVLEVIRKLNSIEDTLVNSQNKLTLEDIRSLLRELEYSLNKYSLIMKRDNFRVTLLLRTPIYVAFFSYIVFFTLKIINGLNPFYDLILVVLGLTALILSQLNLSYTFIVLIIASIYGILSLPFKPRSTDDLYLVLINSLILMSSISYFQIIKNVKSSSFKDKLKNLISGFEELDKKLREASIRDKEQMDNVTLKLEEEIRKIFKEIYGEYGEALMQYKLNVLLMHGTSRKEALKKIYEELKNIAE